MMAAQATMMTAVPESSLMRQSQVLFAVMTWSEWDYLARMTMMLKAPRLAQKSVQTQRTTTKLALLQLPTHDRDRLMLMQMERTSGCPNRRSAKAARLEGADVDPPGV